MEPECRAMPVAPVLHDAVRLVNLKAEQGRLRLDLRVPEGCRVVADPRALKQVALNLLSNAIKFTMPGGTVVVGGPDHRRPRGDLRHRHGIGIEPENIAHILQPFGQVRRPTVRSQSGTGLGLPLSNRLAALMGGTLEIDSTPGQWDHGQRRPFPRPPPPAPGAPPGGRRRKGRRPAACPPTESGFFRLEVSGRRRYKGPLPRQLGVLAVVGVSGGIGKGVGRRRTNGRYSSSPPRFIAAAQVDTISSLMNESSVPKMAHHGAFQALQRLRIAGHPTVVDDRRVDRRLQSTRGSTSRRQSTSRRCRPGRWSPRGPSASRSSRPASPTASSSTTARSAPAPRPAWPPPLRPSGRRPGGRHTPGWAYSAATDLIWSFRPHPLVDQQDCRGRRRLRHRECGPDTSRPGRQGQADGVGGLGEPRGATSGSASTVASGRPTAVPRRS